MFKAYCSIKLKKVNIVLVITSLVVICGFQPLLLSISDKETLPEGKTFGCKITGLNTPKRNKTIIFITFNI